MITRVQPEYILDTPVGFAIYSTANEPPHFQQDAIEVTLCLDGMVDFTVSHRFFKITQGDIVVVNPNEVHYLTSNVENLLATFYFSINHVNYLDKELSMIDFDNIGDHVVPDLNEQIIEIRKRLLTILYYYMEEGKVLASRSITEISDEIIEIMLRDFKLFYMPSNENPHSDELKERFERILMYLKANYDHRITVEELSEREHMSSNYLSQYIKKASSSGFTKILTYIRTHESENMLLSQKKDIVDISYECGFSDPKFYYKSFKDLYSRTPHQHRKIYAELMEMERSVVEYNVSNLRSEIEHFIVKMYLSLPNG